MIIDLNIVIAVILGAAAWDAIKFLAKRYLAKMIVSAAASIAKQGATQAKP